MKTKRANNFFNNFVYLFLLLSPILDSLTSIFVHNIDFPISIGTFFRGIFLLFVLIWLKNNYKNKKILILFLLYALLSIMYFFENNNNKTIISEVNNIFQIFYLPLMMMFFSTYNNEKINNKLLVKIYLLYLNLILIPLLFNIGYTLTDSYSNKLGYFGLFIGGNEISAILVGLSPIVLSYVNKSKSYILKIVTYIELLLVIYLVGTKTLFIGIILTFIYFVYKRIRYSYVVMNEKKSKTPYLILIFIIILLAIFIPRSAMFKNIKTTVKYYKVESIKEVFDIKTLDNVVFSKRLSNLYEISKKYVNGDSKTIIYGLGIDKIKNIKMVEIDLFDIFFSVGIFGLCMYLLLILYTTKFNILRSERSFSVLLFILISIFAGHVLTKPMVSIYIALLYLIEKNELCIEKKKILLVSNMYPSNKSKHYGVFVKNTEELLRDNNFVVDKVVMTKHGNKLYKLLSYIYLHSKTILKCIFNNYDYLYVHFISHSSMGAVIAKKTSKDVKLVLNAHGNDVVRDLKEEEKNISRSKKYIKYADKVIVPSKFMKNVIIEEYNYNEENIIIYPSGGVNSSLFIPIDKEKAKKNCNLKKEYNYIGYISRIEKNKGWDIFLKAISELIKNKEFSNYKFLIVGAGEEQDKFNDLIKELKLFDYLEIRNMVSQEELVNLYNSLDIFVFPTYRKESLGLVGLEAMACETLVIASNNYGPTDYIIDNKNGMFFIPKDYKDLAKKIIKMKNLNNEEKNKMKRKARETAIKYDSVNTKNIILDVFK